MESNANLPRYYVTGSVQTVSNSPNYQAVINITDRANEETRQIWRSTGCKKLTDANKVLVNFIAVCEQQGDLPRKLKTSASQSNKKKGLKMVPPLIQFGPHMPFVELLRNWKTAFERIEETTIEGYEDNYDNHIIPFFVPLNLRLCDVKRRHIQDFVNHMGKSGRLDKKGGLKKSSVKKYVANISSLFEYAIDKEWLDSNACDRVRYSVDIFKEKPHVPKDLKLSEVQRLLEHVTSPEQLSNEEDPYAYGFAASIVFACYYALRRGEILGMGWKAIDFENGRVEITRTRVRVKKERVKDPKNNASKCAMPLIPELEPFFKNLKAHQAKCKRYFGRCYDKNDFVVIQDGGKPFTLNYINDRLARTLDQLELSHVTLHELRHSTATILRTLGYSQQEIQSWLRHADIKSTMRYAHDNFELKFNTATGINDIFAICNVKAD